MVLLKIQKLFKNDHLLKMTYYYKHHGSLGIHIVVLKVIKKCILQISMYVLHLQMSIGIIFLGLLEANYEYFLS